MDKIEKILLIAICYIQAIYLTVFMSAMLEGINRIVFVTYQVWIWVFVPIMIMRFEYEEKK